MKIKFIIILTLLVFCSITCVNACDNITDNNLTSDEPDFTFEEQMWEHNLSDISVNLPENATGEFSVKINDEEIYRQNITNTSFKVPVKLPKDKFIVIASIWPPIDYRNYKVSAFLNDVEFKSPKSLKIMKYSPDYNYIHTFPSEILQYDEIHNLRYALIFPRSANGNVEIYVDNKFISKNKVKGPFIDLANITNLDLGNHTFKILYNEDTYYNAFNKTFDFEIVQALINIPQPVNISHDDCISVYVKNESKVDIYLDSKLISSQKTEDGMAILSLENYLKRNSSEVKVVVSNSKFRCEKTSKISVVYDFDVYPTDLIYGEDSILEVYLPDTLNNKLLTITINGEKYSFYHPSYIMNNIIELDISKLKAGNYTMNLSYPGDDRFDSYEKIVNLTITNSIIYPHYVYFKDSSVIYLNLPKDACGNLDVYINNELKSAKFINGYAEVKIDYLPPGEYQFVAAYTGNDYKVENVSSEIVISPKIKTDVYFTVGEAKSIIMEVPKNTKGEMIVNINNKEYKIQIKNGKAKLSLKKLKIGEYEVEITYVGENGYNTTQYEYLEVIPAKIKIKASNVNILYKNKYTYKIKIYGKDAKPLKNKWIKIKIDKKSYKVKSNKKGLVKFKLPKLSLKTYKIKITYGKIKVTKKIHVKLLKLSKSKNTLKAKLYKALKGESVIFKINSKKYIVKTNNKGIALLKTNKNNAKVSATYFKSTVKL